MGIEWRTLAKTEMTTEYKPGKNLKVWQSDIFQRVEVHTLTGGTNFKNTKKSQSQMQSCRGYKFPVQFDRTLIFENHLMRSNELLSVVSTRIDPVVMATGPPAYLGLVKLGFYETQMSLW